MSNLDMGGYEPPVEKPKSPELTRERLADMQTLEVEITGNFNPAPISERIYGRKS